MHYSSVLTVPYTGQANEYNCPQEELDTEFKKEFPPDLQLGREMDPSARVWKVYRKEATIVDNALLDGWSSTLNILLIFVSGPVSTYAHLNEL